MGLGTSPPLPAMFQTPHKTQAAFEAVTLALTDDEHEVFHNDQLAAMS